MAGHILSAEPIHSRWNRDLAPRIEIASGDTVHIECLDSSGSQVHPGMTVEDFLAIDRGRIHALDQPQPLCFTSSTSTSNVSPGAASRTAIGPVSA
jgi:acetamidase/formamidase